MTTATARPPSPGPKPSPQAPAAPSGLPPIDPVKLLKKYKFVLGAAFAVGLGLGVGSFYLLREVMPRYRSTAIYICNNPTSDPAQPLGTGRGSQDELERFMATQAKIMTSDLVLRQALSNPRLQQEAPKWYSSYTVRGGFDQREALQDLQSQIVARPVPNSTFVEMSWSWSEKVDTAGLLRIVSDAFQAEVKRQSNQGTGEQRETLSRLIRDLDDRVLRLQRQREQAITENDITTLDTRLNEASQNLNIAQTDLAKNRSTQVALSVELERMEREFSSPAGVTYPEDMRSAVENDPAVQNLLRTIQSMEAEVLAMEQRGIGAMHRDRKLLDARIEGWKQKLDQEREKKLREAFGSQLDGVRRSLTSLKAQETDLLTRSEDYMSRLTELTKIQRQITDIDRQIAELSQEKSERERGLANIESLATLASSYRINLYQNAEVPDNMAFPQLRITVPAGVILMMGLVGGFIVLFELLDQRVRGPADIAMIPRTRLLGIVPQVSEDPSKPVAAETAFRDQPRGAIAEAFRQARSPLVKRLQQDGHRTLLVVPCMPGSGATTVAINLAHACAAADVRVLLVDANFRRPALHRVLNLPESPGLGDVLTGSETLESAVRPSGQNGLDVLAVGSPETRVFERLSTEAMTSLLAQAKAKYDLVLVDVAPAVVSGDAIALANRCDASFLVARAYGEKRGLVARLRNELGEARAEFLGVVVNAIRPAAGGYLRKNIRETHSYQNPASGKTKPEPAAESTAA